MSSLLQDIRFALRQLRRSPLFTLTILATLAVTIGVTASMAGVLRATLLNALPYPQPSRLVEVTDHNLRGFKDAGLVGVLRTRDLATLSHNGHNVFASLGFFYYDDSTLTLPDHEPLRVSAAAVSGSFFPTVGAAPLLGRTLTPADDVPNGPQLLVISHRLWQSTFASDPTIIGRSVRLGTSQATIVGVMPPRFDLPATIDLWHPGHIFPATFGDYRADGSRFVLVIARLAPTETLASASAATTGLATQLATRYPATDAAYTFIVTDLRTSLFGNFRDALLLLSAAVLLVLLAAALNIAGLQLSRNSARTPEFAVRSALGITRTRLVRQLLTESLLLTATGATLGLLLAPALLRILASRLPAAITAVDKPHVDLAVVALSVSLALLVGVGTAILPALHASQALRLTSGHAIRSKPRFGRTFAVFQIALALVLLTLSASVLQGLYRLNNLPLGFTAAHVQTFTIDLPWGIDPAKSNRIYTAAEQQLAAIPGVESVGALSALPLSTFTVRRTFDIAGQPPTPNHDAVVAEGRAATPGYLPTLRIPLLSGRNIAAHDLEPDSPSVVLVNHALAQRYFPAGAIGQHLTWDKNSSEIVGVIGDVQGTGGKLAAQPQPEVFYAGANGWPHMQFAVRTAQPMATLELQVRHIVSALDPEASPGHFATLTRTLDRFLIQPRLNAGLLTSFAALSLLLVMLGVYGLVAFEVTQRTRELGLRIALGSSRAGVLTLLLSESTRILAVGLTIGLALSFLASRLLAATILGAQRPSAILLLATSVVLALSVLSSTFLPARRASRLDPMEALKTA